MLIHVIVCSGLLLCLILLDSTKAVIKQRKYPTDWTCYICFPLFRKAKIASGGAAPPSIPMVQEGKATSAAAAAPSLSTVEKAPGLFR